MTWTCLCKTAKDTFFGGGGKHLFLCSFHAKSHRDGHTFTVMPYLMPKEAS